MTRVLKKSPTVIRHFIDGCEGTEEEQAIAREFHFAITHLDRRGRFALFSKCEKRTCAHCSAHPPLPESKAAIYDLMQKHGFFYSPTPHPENPSNYFNYEHIVNLPESVKFVPD